MEPKKIVSHTPVGKTLDSMQEIVYMINKSNGWFESNRTFGDEVALIHSEVSEALEAYRTYGLDDATEAPGAKPEGVGSELADILIRLLDVTFRLDIDLEAEFNRKCIYNATRGYRHGGKRL